jgi:hypothetical protein
MQEVGGSIPPGSTNLRRLRQLRLGKPIAWKVPRTLGKAQRGRSVPHLEKQTLALENLRRV